MVCVWQASRAVRAGAAKRKRRTTAVPGARPHLRVAASGEVSFLDRAGALGTNLNGFIFFIVERNSGIVGEQQEEQRRRRAAREG